MEASSETTPEQKPIVINIEPVEETPREKEVKAVAEKARSTALEKLGQATNLTDYMCWHRAASVYLTPSSIDWIWDYDGTTAEDLIAEQESERFTAGNARNARAAEALRPVVEALEPKEGVIRIGLKRVRYPDSGGRYEYRTLAAFPEGTFVGDPLDGAIKPNRQGAEEDIIFFEPENACVSHACDDLYKAHRDSAFYMPVKTLSDAIRALQTNRQGVNEYLLEKTESGSVKQDAENYILVGLLGGYSNERFRVRVSDFWGKTPQQTTPSPTK